MTGVLHDFPLDDEGYKVRLGLSAMGIAHEVVAVDAIPGREPETAAFRALNPLVRLPLWRAVSGCWASGRASPISRSSRPQRSRAIGASRMTV